MKQQHSWHTIFFSNALWYTLFCNKRCNSPSKKQSREKRWFQLQLRWTPICYCQWTLSWPRYTLSSNKSENLSFPRSDSFRRVLYFWRLLLIRQNRFGRCKRSTRFVFESTFWRKVTRVEEASVWKDEHKSVKGINQHSLELCRTSLEVCCWWTKSI